MNLINELKRRNVLRVAAAYGALAWLLLQIADVVIPILGLPDWTARYLLVALVIGLPIVIALAWVYELTPEGLKRETDIDPAQPVLRHGSRKIDLGIIALLTLAVCYFVLDKFFLGPPAEQAPGGVPYRSDASVAVLPFANIADDEESLALARGIHEDLLTQLAKIADLTVISRTSVVGYADTTKNLRQIGAELGVRHVLEGSVQSADGRIRINAQLIDAATDEHLWAEKYDRDLTTGDIFAIQTELAGRIADALHVELSDETAAALAKVSTTSLAAYRQYLEGMRIIENPAVSDREALDAFQAAVAEDPQFALAWVRLADIWRAKHWREPDESDALEQAVAALQRAEEIDPALPQIHLVRARLQYHGYLNYDEALHELALAEQGLPGDAEVFDWRGIVYRHMGRIAEAITAFEEAIRLDPRNPYVVWELGGTLQMMRRYDDARALFDDAIEAFPEHQARWRFARAEIDWDQFGDASGSLRALLRPDWPRSGNYHLLVTWNAWLAGDLDTAVSQAEHLETGVETGIGFYTYTTYMTPAEVKGAVLAAAGRAEQAQAWFRAALLRVEEELRQQPGEYRRLFSLARLHAFLGDDAAALRLADEAMAAFDQHDRVFHMLETRAMHGRVLCHAGALDAAEEEFRWVLSRQNGYTLASLMNGWPPCKERMLRADTYQRLNEEFGHLSGGRGTPRSEDG